MLRGNRLRVFHYRICRVVNKKEFLCLQAIPYFGAMSFRKTKSKILKKSQELILLLRLNYLIKPFTGAFHKLYYLSKFADWKKGADHPKALKGYTDRFDLYARVITEESLKQICYYEFGVSKGESMRWWLDQIPHKDSRFYGFDTFDGIPEAWGTMPKGSYTAHGNSPRIHDPRCTFIKGLFQDTLRNFLKEQACRDRLVIHLDADLYSSTLFCLFALSEILKPGDILIFDEFSITTHEFRAFLDFRNTFDLKFSFIGESNHYNKVVLKIV